MSDYDRTIVPARLRLALAIQSGRINSTDLTIDQYTTLGYDTYKFGYYPGKPTGGEILEKCEEEIADALMPIAAQETDAIARARSFLDRWKHEQYDNGDMLCEAIGIIESLLKDR